MTVNTSSILTNNYYSLETEKLYYSLVPNSDLKYNTDNNLYLFLSALKDWDDEFAPPTPEKTERYYKKVKKNIFAIKKITTPDVFPVIERIDWQANSYFDIYTDSENLYDKGSDGKLLKKFYARNSFDQVFKCLWNGQNTDNAYQINNITENQGYVTVSYINGIDMGSGKYIRIQGCDPQEFNGVYKTATTSANSVNIIIDDNERFKITSAKANSVYVANGTIKFLETTSEEPMFDIGTFNKENIIITNDGYKWRYIYTIDPGKKQKFFSNDWMPISPTVDRKYSAKANFGQIDAINIISRGDGYQNGNSTIAVSVTGDGQGIEAYSYVSNNKLLQIYVANTGSDYTYANVNLIPNAYGGNNAIAVASVSPSGGHGSDPLSEFGCKNAMITCQVIGTEDGNVPVDIKYRQLGLISNPYSIKDLTAPANNSIYEIDTRLLLSDVNGTFLNDEVLYQGISLNNQTYMANCLSFTSNDDLRVINTDGSISLNYPIYGANSGAHAIVVGEVLPDILINSGRIVYIENRVSVTRSENDTELFRLVINY